MKIFLCVFSLILLCGSGLFFCASHGLGQPLVAERSDSSRSGSPISHDSGALVIVDVGDGVDVPPVVQNHQELREEDEAERCRSHCRVGTTLCAGALTCAGLGWFLCAASHHMSHH